LGDVPSPPLIGAISDASSLGTAVLIVPVAVFVPGRFGSMRLGHLPLGERLTQRKGVRLTSDSPDLLHIRFLKTAKRRWFSWHWPISSGKELSYGKALAGSLALARPDSEAVR